MSETTPQPSAPPAGWYNDSDGRMRWWNGRAWTDAYAPIISAPPKVPTSPFNVLGFVLGLVALVLFVSWPVGLGLGVLGLVASISGYADKVRRGRGFAVAGMVISGAAILLGALTLIRGLIGA